jgi:tRNA (guanine37-N1)-methyltransferase
MVMKPEPLVEAIEAARARRPGARVILMGPRGRVFDQQVARELHALGSLVLVCGRYEGVDERVLDFVDEEMSLGDFVLTGGELAAVCIVDAVTRLEPGVLGNLASASSESFEEGVLEYPQYTRPPEFRGKRVPEVLLSGDHARVARWRRAMSLKATRERRPDLFAKLTLSEQDRVLLKEMLEGEGESHAQQDT